MSVYKQRTLEEIAALIQGEDVLIVCHTNPDADTIGSAFALAELTRMIGGTAKVVCSDPIPERLLFLSHKEDTLYCEETDAAKKMICVDVASPAQLGSLRDLAPKASLMIDHHQIGEKFADFLIDAAASATGVLIYELYAWMQEQNLISESARVARLLYAAISSDTGSFRYSNTDSRALFAASELVKTIRSDKDGEDTAEISRLLFETKKLSELKAQKIAIDNLQLFEEGCFAVTTITLEQLRMEGLSPEDCSCIVDVPRSVSGVLVGIALREKSSGEYRLSARANCGIDVASVCALFGGGGHTRAAGATIFSDTIEGAFKQIFDPFASAVREFLNAKQ